MTAPASHFYTVKTDTLEAVSLHYLTFGKSDNPAVLCVHGLTCQAYDFEYLARELAKDFYVIVPDMPGRGLSSPLSDPANYHNEHYRQYCAALLEHLGVTNVHWIGASMGGMIGMLAAWLQPDMVQTLMLCDVGKVLASEGLKEIFLYAGKEPVTDDNEEFEAQLREAYSGFHFTDDTHWQHFFTHRVKKDAKGHYHLRCDPQVIKPLRAQARSQEEVNDISLEMLWEHVRCPVLIFRGRESSLFRENTALSMRDDDGKDVTLHQFEHVGHMPNLYEKEQISLIHTWLLKH